MLDQYVDEKTRVNGFPTLADASVAGYFILDHAGRICQSDGLSDYSTGDGKTFIDSFPMLQQYLKSPEIPGGFYEIPVKSTDDAKIAGRRSVYIGSIPDRNRLVGIVYENLFPDISLKQIKSELSILSLITQAVRAFNRADDLENILKIVLIGVTAGCGLGFNRAFILLTDDKQNCLKGALANGPSSPEEAAFIWQKLSKGELTLDKMFDNTLSGNEIEISMLNRFIKKLIIPLDNKDNIFARAAIEKKSIIIDEEFLGGEEYSVIHSSIGPGPLAVVPLVGNEYLQGVLLADNLITRKEISRNDIHLLEIFARYASDSIEKFRLNKKLSDKLEALKKANETILRNRENVIKAERLSVLAEMAGQVAHEIRNPLTIIGGFTKLMLKKLPRDEEHYEDLETIVDQVTRIEMALEKFSSLMNYQSKDDQICDLGELVRSALSITLSGIDFSNFQIQHTHPITIKIDPDLFRQALLIILKRMIKIRQNSEPILISIERSNNKAIISFKSACSDDNLANILYKNFHFMENHQKFKELSTVLEIIKYYSGNIGLEVAVNEDNKFYIELPVYEEVR